MIYSRMKSAVALEYAITLVVFVIVRFRGTIKNLIKQNNQVYEQSFEDGGEFRYGSMLMNSWSWFVDDKVEYNSNISAVSNMILT